MSTAPSAPAPPAPTPVAATTPALRNGHPDEAPGDARLAAWRDTLAGAATTLLRAYHTAWSAPGADEAALATAGIGIAARARKPRERDLGSPVRPPARSFAAALPGTGTLAGIVHALDLDPGEEALVAAAWWAAADPQIGVAFGAVHDDPRRRMATPAAVHLLLIGLGIAVPGVLGEDDRLVTWGLLEPAPMPDTPLRLTPTAAALLAGSPRPEAPSPDLPARLAGVAGAIASLLDAGERVVVRCEAADDIRALRDGVAGLLGRAPSPRPRGLRAAGLLHALERELPTALLGPGETPPDGTLLALGSAEAAVPAQWHAVDVPAPTVAAAERVWRRELRRAGLAASTTDTWAYAGLLSSGESGIRDVVERATRIAGSRDGALTHVDVHAALRDRCDRDPGGLARRVPAMLRLDDLVLAPATRHGLDDLVAQARWSAAAHEALGTPGPRGRAVVGLFHGPSGTGKTAAAEAVAAAAGRDLWVADLAKVVSKWLGETQRNLDLLLGAAETAGVVLLFDEADGLFGKRGEVSDARDRYANLEIDFLLQRLELHRGVVVLTSNRPAAIDEAFARRIRLSIRFDAPDYADREELWRRHLPPALLAGNASTARAAREELTGAAIRAAALTATVRAIADGRRVTEADLDAAVARELEKVRRARPAGRGSS